MLFILLFAGLVLNPDPESESESEASEGSHDPGSRTESPELDDVRGKVRDSWGGSVQQHQWFSINLVQYRRSTTDPL